MNLIAARPQPTIPDGSTLPVRPPVEPAIILIVDDLPANRQVLVELLASPLYQLLEAASGPVALAMAAVTPPDLVLLDVMMPGMDGYEVCRRLRAEARFAEVPVILITALDDKGSRLTGIEAGADDFISKPFNRLELLARVKSITRLNRYRRLLESQTALAESERRFSLLAEQCAEAFRFIALQPERIVYTSPAVEKIWGVPVARFRADARLWLQLIHPEDRPRVLAAYEAVLAGRLDRLAEEYRVVRPDGSMRWVQDSGTPLRDPQGLLVSVGGVTQDITEQKAGTELLLRAQRVENIGMLATGIAHDFNNALAPLLMGAALLRPHAPGPHGQRLLDTMEKSAARCVALVRQLLAFARGASGQHQLLQARHILRELQELAEMTFPKLIRVNVDLPAGLWPILANATQIHQVFLNLCVNARDAMPQGGVLSLAAANCTLDVTAATHIPEGRPGHFLAVVVRDTGTGIPPEVLPRIWEPFFTTKALGVGTGLGLSTVRGILRQHDAFVTVETSAAHGTTFTVYLPAADEAPDGETRAPMAVPTPGQGELILVVDDEAPVRQIATDTLQAHGYRTLTAADGAEAIATFAQHQAEVRLLLTDLQMPVLGGEALLAVIHRLQPLLPVVVMSGLEAASNPADAAPGPAFLAKPFRAETLLALVRLTLDRAQAGATKTIAG